MAIFNTTHTLNMEIRLYGVLIQKEIAFGKARATVTDDKDLYYKVAHYINDFQ